jgi:Domain of unknown function (DUF4440)
MPSRLCITLAAVVFTVFSSTTPPTVGGEQRLLTPEQTQIVNTVSRVFTAARKDDVAKFESVIAPDFYIFDAGARFDGDAIMALIKAQHAAGKRHEWSARFDGDAIMALIKAQHAAGKRHEWNVTEPDVHISGNTAWIAYVNKGSISDASGTINQKWLESAFLEKRKGVWKIVFMHSTRIDMPPPESDGK